MARPPAQSHSDTSVEAARALRAARLRSQERRLYDWLQQYRSGLADWQLWNLARITTMFDQLSSCRRARVGLVWRSRREGATVHHPVEDSGRRIADPNSDKQTVVWQIKPRFRGMTYDQWYNNHRFLAHGETNE